MACGFPVLVDGDVELSSFPLDRERVERHLASSEVRSFCFPERSLEAGRRAAARRHGPAPRDSPASPVPEPSAPHAGLALLRILRTGECSLPLAPRAKTRGA